MKRPKKPTYLQKKRLSKQGFKADEYRFIEEDKYAELYIHKDTKETIWVTKERG